MPDTWTLRIIAQHSDATMAAHAGGPVVTSYRTFDVPAPAELVAFLTAPTDRQLETRSIVGVELVED